MTENKTERAPKTIRDDETGRETDMEQTRDRRMQRRRCEGVSKTRVMTTTTRQSYNDIDTIRQDETGPGFHRRI